MENQRRFGVVTLLREEDTDTGERHGHASVATVTVVKSGLSASTQGSDGPMHALASRPLQHHLDVDSFFGSAGVHHCRTVAAPVYRPHTAYSTLVLLHKHTPQWTSH